MLAWVKLTMVISKPIGWSDEQVRSIAESFSKKRPKRKWFNSAEGYPNSLKSWAHIVANQLYMMHLDERQLIVFMYFLGNEMTGVQTFDPSDERVLSDYDPHEKG